MALFLIVPLLLVRANTDSMQGLHVGVFVPLLLLALFGTIALLVFDAALRRLTQRPLVAVAAEFCLFFVLATGFFLPAIRNGGMTDPGGAPIDAMHIALALPLAFSLLLAARSSHRRSLYAAIVAFIAVNTVVSVPAIQAVIVRPTAVSQNPSTYAASAESNIFVLSFDGIPGSAVVEVLDEDLALADAFAGFTLFDNIASSSPATSASTATSLLGNRNYKASSATTDELWRDNADRLLTNVLGAGGYVVSPYGEYGREFQGRAHGIGSLAAQGGPSWVTLLNLTLARSLSPAAVLPDEASSRLERLFDGLQAQIGAVGPMGSFRASHAPSWKRDSLTPTILDFDRYLKHLHVGTHQPAAHLLHFTFTHFPVEFDRACQLRATNQEWFESHQNRDGVKDEVRCALAQYVRFLERLREIGVYDDSLIVLKSDHGMPVSYGDPSSIEAATIHDHPLWGYGSYAPFLAIKDRGSDTAPLVHDASPVLLDDLATTICRHSSLDVDCAMYPGHDLLSEGSAGIEESQVTMFVVKSPDSDHRYDTHEPITIRRGANIVESLRAALSE